VTYYFNPDVIWANLDKFLQGLALGLALALAALTIGAIVGLFCAFASLSRSRLPRVIVSSYVTAIRNVPLLVIVLFAYFGLPRIGLTLGKIESFIISLALYSGAYLTEVFRAGLAGVPQGVIDAGRSIGLGRLGLSAYVIFPIMLRNALPALGTTFISLFKDTSIAATIAVPELTYEARKLNTETFRVAEAWLSASVLYIATCLILAAALRGVERRFPRF
jgi:His/Glu/Gln/Arg/opine family amino acid ABC transporter permease subunit